MILKVGKYINMKCVLNINDFFFNIKVATEILNIRGISGRVKTIQPSV